MSIAIPKELQSHICTTQYREAVALWEKLQKQEQTLRTRTMKLHQAHATAVIQQQNADEWSEACRLMQHAGQDMVAARCNLEGVVRRFVMEQQQQTTQETIKQLMKAI